MRIRFVSSDACKIREVRTILESDDIVVVPVSIKIEEIQTENVQSLVHQKVLKAFQRIGRPVFVEHTVLELKGLNGLPGGLTQIFWDRLQADTFAALVNGLSSRVVTARTVIGYCDGQSICFFEGEVTGTVPEEPAGDREFQWDCVFVPDGYEQTFAELGAKKNQISMRRRALDEFATFLRAGK